MQHGEIVKIQLVDQELVRVQVVDVISGEVVQIQPVETEHANMQTVDKRVQVEDVVMQVVVIALTFHLVVLQVAY